MKRVRDNEFSYYLSQQKIGEILGVSKQRVEQIEKIAIKKIRKYLDENPSKLNQIHESLVEVCNFDYDNLDAHVIDYNTNISCRYDII